MCSPTLLFSVVSTAFSAFSQMQQGKAEAKAVQAQAANNMKIAQYNAGIQEGAAKDAIVRGGEDAAVIRENAKRENATARAIMSSTGLVADTGTNLKLLGQNAQMGELNASQTMNNAEREAYGYRQNATGILFEGKVGVNNAAYQSSIIKSNAKTGAIGTLVTGAANFGSKLFSGGTQNAYKPTTYYPGSGGWSGNTFTR